MHVAASNHSAMRDTAAAPSIVSAMMAVQRRWRRLRLRLRWPWSWSCRRRRSTDLLPSTMAGMPIRGGAAIRAALSICALLAIVALSLSLSALLVTHLSSGGGGGQHWVVSGDDGGGGLVSRWRLLQLQPPWSRWRLSADSSPSARERRRLATAALQQIDPAAWVRQWHLEPLRPPRLYRTEPATTPVLVTVPTAFNQSDVHFEFQPDSPPLRLLPAVNESAFPVPFRCSPEKMAECGDPLIPTAHRVGLANFPSLTLPTLHEDQLRTIFPRDRRALLLGAVPAPWSLRLTVLSVRYDPSPIGSFHLLMSLDDVYTHLNGTDENLQCSGAIDAVHERKRAVLNYLLQHRTAMRCAFQPLPHAHNRSHGHNHTHAEQVGDTESVADADVASAVGGARLDSRLVYSNAHEHPTGAIMEVMEFSCPYPHHPHPPPDRLNFTFEMDLTPGLWPVTPPVLRAVIPVVSAVSRRVPLAFCGKPLANLLPTGLLVDFIQHHAMLGVEVFHIYDRYNQKALRRRLRPLLRSGLVELHHAPEHTFFYTRGKPTGHKHKRTQTRWQSGGWMVATSTETVSILAASSHCLCSHGRVVDCVCAVRPFVRPSVCRSPSVSHVDVLQSGGLSGSVPLSQLALGRICRHVVRSQHAHSTGADTSTRSCCLSVGFDADCSLLAWAVFAMVVFVAMIVVCSFV